MRDPRELGEWLLTERQWFTGKPLSEVYDLLVEGESKEEENEH